MSVSYVCKRDALPKLASAHREVVFF